MLVISGGSEFQMWGATTLKARDATTNLVRGMTKSILSAERWFRVGTYFVNNSLRGFGSPVCRILYVSRDTL